MPILYNRARLIVNGVDFNPNGPGYIYGLDLSMDAGATWVDGMSADFTAKALHGNIHPMLGVQEYLTADGVPVNWMTFDWASQKIDFQLIPSSSSAIGGDAYATAGTMILLPNLFWKGQSLHWSVDNAAYRSNDFMIQGVPTFITL